MIYTIAYKMTHKKTVWCFRSWTSLFWDGVIRVQVDEGMRLYQGQKKELGETHFAF